MDEETTLKPTDEAKEVQENNNFKAILIKKLEDKRKTRVLDLFIKKNINFDSINEIYVRLEKDFKGTENLDVIVNSGGGDIHSAYHLAKVLRKYAKSKLVFIVPRWAKSAATLLVFGGDKIIMGPTSELGPLDPQVTEIKDGVPQITFSPLAIKTALELINQNRNNPELVKELSAKLPETIQLGQHLKSLEIAENYVYKLLTSRMLKQNPAAAKIASNIGKMLTQNYPDHGYCIDAEEASSLGLIVEDCKIDEWKIIWDLYQINYLEEKNEQNKTLRKILKDKGLSDKEIENEIEKTGFNTNFKFNLIGKHSGV